MVPEFPVGFEPSAPYAACRSSVELGRLLAHCDRRHFIGGTEYMWDTHYALWLRLLSCFHIGLPIVLLWALLILGYDRRALPLQTAITGAVLVFSRFLPPEFNMNYAFQDPLLHRAWGPAPSHLVVILAGCIVIFFWPMHLVFLRAFPLAQKSE